MKTKSKTTAKKSKLNIVRLYLNKILKKGKLMKPEIQYFKNEKARPHQLIERDPRHDKNPPCLDLKGYRICTSIFEKHARYVFYNDNPSLSVSKRMKVKYLPYAKYVTVRTMINKHGIKAKTLQRKERTTKRQILCVSDIEIYQALLLVPARVFSELYTKHQDELKNEAALMLKYSLQFIELCESLKVECKLKPYKGANRKLNRNDN